METIILSYDLACLNASIALNLDSFRSTIGSG